jgi:hypothetical protein
MAEDSPKVAPTPAEGVEHTTELTESRKGAYFHAEVGLPAGFEPPSAALVPAPQPAAPVQAAADTSSPAGQDAPRGK